MEDTIFFTRASLPPFEEYIEEIRDCWETRWITTMGPKHALFEQQLKELLEVKHTKVFANGHSALEIMIQAMNLQGEVITTPFTFASTSHAIMRSGLVPRFCDIKITDYTIDERQIESLINEKTVAILGVHVFGNVCDDDKIRNIAKKHNLRVLYDGAHAFGVRKNGISVGNLGDATMYSFHASKVFNTIEGGAVVWSSDDYSFAERLEKLRVFGVGEDEFVELVGTNGKMNEFEAAMGICNLRHFAEEKNRRKIADAYYRENLKEIDGLILNSISEDIEPNYSYFPIYVDETVAGHTRDELHVALHRNNILSRKHFYQLANTYPCYPTTFSNDKTPVAEQVARNIISLPLYAGLSEGEIDRICSVIKTVILSPK